MRMMKVLLAAGVAAAMLFGMNSCKKDESIPVPTVSFVDGNDKVLSGTLNLNNDGNTYVKVVADAKTKVATVTYQLAVTMNDGSTTKYPTSAPKPLTEDKAGDKVAGAQKTTVFIGDEAGAGKNKIDLSGLKNVKEITVKIVATDKNGGVTNMERKATYTGAATTVNPNPEPTPGTTTGTLLTNEQHGAINHANGGGKMGWDLDNDVALGMKDANSSNGSMLNLSDGPDSKFKPAFTSGTVKTPSEITGNGTQYVKVASFDYANATKEAAEKAFAAGTPSVEVQDVQEGQVIIGKKDTKLYVIKITAVSTTGTSTRAGEGYIEFSYKK